MDQTKLGEVVAGQMEAIEKDHKDAMLGDVLVLTQVVSERGLELRVRGSVMAPNARKGLLMEALFAEIFGT